MVTSSHVRTVFGHGISSPNPQRFWNSTKHTNLETERQLNNLPDFEIRMAIPSWTPNQMPIGNEKKVMS